MLSYNSYKPTDKEREYVGKIINIEPNDISYKFFNDNNVDYINNSLIEQVKEITLERYGKKMQIQPQRKHIVVSIMRHIYFKNIKNVFPADDEVDMLNKEVLRQMVPMVVRELIAHMRYIYDYNSIIPMDLPKADNKKMGNLGSFNKLFTIE
jgi:hypothetical protein